jgi:hypothetical protein
VSLASAFTDCELTSSEIAVISAGAQARHYAREAVIASESDCGIFFLVVSGHVVLKETRNGIEHVAGTASTGDVVCAEATAVPIPTYTSCIWTSAPCAA